MKSGVERILRTLLVMTPDVCGTDTVTLGI